MSYAIDAYADEKFMDRVTETVMADLSSRLEGKEVSHEVYVIVVECMINAVWNGARLAEELIRNETRLVMADGSTP